MNYATNYAMNFAMNHSTSFFRSVIFTWIVIMLSACALHPTPTPTYYSLDLGANPTSRAPAPDSDQAPTLLIGPMVAASGFDSTHIIYTRVEHQLDYFAQSLWIDTPARMLAPLMAATLADSGAFHAVVPSTAAANGDLRLLTEIVRLQHDFATSPSQLRFTLRATIVDNATRKVLAWHEFDVRVASASDTPYDGIKAANSAVQIGLQQLSVFCYDVARQWQARKNITQANNHNGDRTGN